MKLATTTSEEVVENLPIISEPLVAAWKCFTGASWPLGVSMSPPAPPLWVPSSSPHDVCSGRGRLMVTSLQYCNEWVLPIPILCWFPLPPHSFVSCVGNGHVVLENHLLDNGSVLPSDRQGNLILKCLSGLKVIVVILRRALQGTVPNLKGDPNYSERGPKGDLILSKKGTKKGTQNSSCSINRKEITCWNFPEIESRRRKNYVCFLLSFKQTDISLINNF